MKVQNLSIDAEKTKFSATIELPPGPRYVSTVKPFDPKESYRQVIERIIAGKITPLRLSPDGYWEGRP